MGIIRLKAFKKIFLKRSVKGNLKVSGNYRLKKGLYYTQEEKEKYIQKSLGRKLP